MVTIKEATTNAMAFAVSALGPDRTRGIRLEEVEFTTIAGQDVWLITLSMITAVEVAGIGIIPTVFDNKREYKVFAVLRSNGEVLSMKIRELANA